MENQLSDKKTVAIIKNGVKLVLTLEEIRRLNGLVARAVISKSNLDPA